MEDFSNYINAVIDRRSFERITGYIDRAKKASDATVRFGGTSSDETGYFVAPTLIETDVARLRVDVRGDLRARS